MTKMIERDREERGERRRKKEKEREREKKRWVSLSETVRYPPLKIVICV